MRVCGAAAPYLALMFALMFALSACRIEGRTVIEKPARAAEPVISSSEANDLTRGGSCQAGAVNVVLFGKTSSGELREIAVDDDGLFRVKILWLR